MEMLQKLLKNNYLYVFLIIIGSGLLIFLVDRFMRRENFESYAEEIKQIARENDVAKDKYKAQDVSQTSIEVQNQEAIDVVDEAVEMAGDEKIDNEIKPEDLIPNDDAADLWANVNPKGEGSLEAKNLLEAAYHIGVDTQSNSLRNANQSIRSDPSIPIKSDVSPWSMTTMNPDPYRKTFEIS
jgi:hypothetical protein